VTIPADRFSQRLPPLPSTVTEPALARWLQYVRDELTAAPYASRFSELTPESRVTARTGTLGINEASGTTRLWLKLTGDSNTGWVSLLTQHQVIPEVVIPPAETQPFLSTNTIRAESGNTVSALSYFFSASTFSGAFGSFGTICVNDLKACSGNTISAGTYAMSASTFRATVALQGRWSGNTFGPESGQTSTFTTLGAAGFPALVVNSVFTPPGVAGVVFHVGGVSSHDNLVQVRRAGPTDDCIRLMDLNDTVAQLAINVDGRHEWGSGGASAADVNLYRSGVNILASDDTLQLSGNLNLLGNFARFAESATSRLGVSNNCFVYAKDNGAGKTQLIALFGSGAEQVIATEP